MNNIVVENLIPHLPKDDAWNLARCSKGFHRIIRNSNAFWLTMIRDISILELPQKFEVIRCYKILQDVTARKLFVNIWVMLCTKNTNELRYTPLSLRVAIFNKSEKLDVLQLTTFLADLSPAEQTQALPVYADRMEKEFNRFPFLLFQLRAPDPLLDLLLAKFDKIEKLNNSKLATLALQYITFENSLGYNQVMGVLAKKRSSQDIQEFCESLLIKTFEKNQVSLEFLTHIFTLLRRKDYSLEKVAIIQHALRHKNAIELIELLVSKGAKAINDHENRSPIEFYLFRVASYSPINVEILNYLEKLGDTYFEQFPICKAMVEAEKSRFVEYHPEYFMNFTDENIDAELSRYANSKRNFIEPETTELVKTLLAAGYKSSHFIPFLEFILTDKKCKLGININLIEIFENLKKRGVDLSSWEKDGENLLHMLFKGLYWNSVQVVIYLLDNKISPLKLNGEGKLPLNLLLDQIFNEDSLESKIYYLSLFLPAIQKMVEDGVCIYDENGPSKQFSESETIWLACLLGYKKLLFQRLTPKHIGDVSALALTDDIDIVKHMLGSIEFNLETTGRFLNLWIQFLNLYTKHEVLNAEVLDLVLKKLDKIRYPLDEIWYDTLSPLLSLHSHQRISTERVIEFIKKIPSIYNPKSKCHELIMLINPTSQQGKSDNEYDIIKDIEEFKDRMEPLSSPYDSVGIVTDNPLKEISGKDLGLRLLLPLYEIYPGWFKAGDFFEELYKTLLEIKDPAIQNEAAEVCNELLKKLKLSNGIKTLIYDSSFKWCHQFSKIFNATPSLQQHIIDHFFTRDIPEDKTREYHFDSGQVTNLEELFRILSISPPPQEFWHMIKNVLERCSIDYTCPSMINTFIGCFEEIKEENLETIKQILEFLWDKSGRIPTRSLHELIRKGISYLPLIEHLVSKGHPIDFLNNTKDTPLHIACSLQQDLGIVKFLLEKGANPDLENAENETPWEITKRVKNFELGLLLQQRRLI